MPSLVDWKVVARVQQIPSVVTVLRADNVKMLSSRGADRRPQRKDLWERWTTRIAVICGTLALLGVGVYAQSYASPQHATWQGKTTMLLREIGFAPGLEGHDVVAK